MYQTEAKPTECTHKGSCEVATELTEGNKLWSTNATSTKHVSSAQELGMNYGVVELKDCCDTDLTSARGKKADKDLIVLCRQVCRGVKILPKELGCKKKKCL